MIYQLFPRILFHLLPLVPFSFGFNWLGIATLLLVVVSYIKVKKLEQQIDDQIKRKADPEEIEALRRIRNFWLGLTFLKDK